MTIDVRPTAGEAEPGLVISHLFQSRSPRAERLLDLTRLWSLRRVPEPDWLADRPGRRLFHWGLGPVLADFQKAFVSQGLDRYLTERPVELFSFDLGPAARHHQGILPLSRPLGAAAVRRHTEAALRFVRRFYQGPLAAENYNFYPTGLYGHITEPAFIQRHLEEFGLGLVLDLAHGAVTAHNLGCRPEDYFAELPLERVMEIHVSRPWLPPDPDVWAVDAHALPAAREWSWLTGVLRSGRCPRAVPVFIEYYGDLGRLAQAQADLTALWGTPA